MQLLMSSSKVLQLGLNCLNKVFFFLVNSDIDNKIMMNFQQLFFIMSIIDDLFIFIDYYQIFFYSSYAIIVFKSNY